MFSANFGSLCRKVTNFGSQNFGYQIWFCTWLQQTAQCLLKLDSNRRFFSPCDFGIWWMTSKNNSRSRRDFMRLSNKRSPYLFGVATANRTKVTTPNKYGTEIIARMSDWENRALLYYVKLMLCIMSNPSVNSKWSYSQETLNSGWNWRYFVPCDPQIWWMTLENNRAPLLYYVKLCASFQIHRWSETWGTGRKRSIRVKIDDFFSRINLEMWWMTLKKQ